MQPNEEYRLTLQSKLKENPNNIEALINLGALEFECFRNDKAAISLLEKAITMDPLNVNAKFWLAMCLYYNRFEYEKSEKTLREALEIDPHRPDCLSLMAWIIREKNGSIPNAIKLVQKALSYEPNWPMLRWQLAKLYLLEEKIALAEEEIKKALEMDLQPIKITNEVERYYESVVTGRTWRDLASEFEDLLEDLRKRKLKY